MTYLPDVNVWIALVAEQSVHHLRAREWFETSREQIAFCRITQLGFLRLLTNRHVMQEEVLTPAEAWDTYRRFRLNQRIDFAHEPPGFPEEWRSSTPPSAASPNLWTDAYLAAFADESGFTLVTFDRKLPAQTGKRAMVLGTTN